MITSMTALDGINKPMLIMLIGLPASGKTSYREMVQKSLSAFRNDTFVYSTDDFIEKEAETLGKTYNEIFKETVDEAKQCNERGLRLAVEQSKNVIWDQTNLTSNVRKNRLKKFNDYYKIGICIASPSFERLLELNELRKTHGRDIPTDVLKFMTGRFEQPNLSEGFDSLCFVKF